MAIKKQKKRKVEITERGIAHIQASFNNTLVTITNEKGDTIASSSGGGVGYKGTKKSTPYVANQAAQNAARKAHKEGVKRVDIKVKGVSQSRESAIRGLYAAGLQIDQIHDVTPIPYGGCRPKKARKA